MSGAKTGPPLPPCPHCGKGHGEELLKCPETDMPLPLAGRLLDKKFRLVFKIGTGGMASVWLAKNLNVDRNVAIKLLRPEVMKVPELISRFRDEARAAARIGSKHICEVYDFGTSSLGPFIVMEQLVGEDLASVIERHVKLDYGWAVRIVREALKGLESAHDKGIVHRDLKPGNIFLHETDGELVVKLMDFGVSKFMDGSSEAETASGILLGTPEYMAPEQLKGAANIDHRADVFAIGAILYRAITGEQVFSGPNLAAKLMSMAHDTPTPIEEHTDGVPEDLIAIVNRCLEREPVDRFQTARALRAALAPFDDKADEEFSLSSSVGAALSSGSLTNGLAPLDSGASAIEPSDLPTRIEATPDAPIPVPAAEESSRRPLWIGLGLLVALIGGGVWWSASGRAANNSAASDSASANADGDLSSLPPPPPALDLPADGPGDDGETGATGETGDVIDSDGETGETGDVIDSDGETGDGIDSDGESGGPLPEQDEGGDGDAIADNPLANGTGGGAQDPETLSAAPRGTFRNGRLLTPDKPGPTSDHRTAYKYCEQLSSDRFAGVSKWKLANPTQAKSFIGNKEIKRGRYWTTAKWQGNVSVFSLPGGRKSSVDSDRKNAKPLCVVDKS